MRIGVLALQGAFAAHRRMLADLGHEAPLVRIPADLEGLDGLVIPGGESTTIWMQMESSGLLERVRSFGRDGGPMFGTCAGAVLCSREIQGSEQPTLGLADVVIDRNAYGRQRESFEAPIAVPSLGEEPVVGVFIRAPRIVRLGPGVESLGELDGDCVLARQENLLLCAFHPELTEDRRIHRAFADLCAARRGARSPS